MLKNKNNFSVILVGPKYSGNIGAIARVMKNFSVSKLLLVNPCSIDKEAYQRAMHAVDILESAESFSSFDEAVKDIDYIAGTTGVANISEKRHIRNAVTPKEFAETITHLPVNIGIVFGREDFGLFNEELKKCDILITVPCSKEYPIMNISHAACVIFYELNMVSKKTKKPTAATKFEKEKLLEQFSNFLDEINYPAHKKDNTKIMFRRLIGRAALSKWEFYTFMGLLSRTEKIIKK